MLCQVLWYGLPDLSKAGRTGNGAITVCQLAKRWAAKAGKSEDDWSGIDGAGWEGGREGMYKGGVQVIGH